MPEIIGLMTAWGNEDWIVPAMRQAAAFCDEVIICIAPHTVEMEKFEDGTYDRACEVLENFPDYVKVLGDFGLRGTHAEIKPRILNTMLDHSDKYKKDNWIWLLDVDEFYPIRSYNKIRDTINRYGDILTKMAVKEKFFYINFDWFLRGWHWRFFKIKENNMDPKFRFQAPVQRWFTKQERVYTIEEEYGMFHYSMLMNPHQKMAFWKSEYPGKAQETKIRFLDYIYRNYDLNNPDYWNDEVRKLFGLRSPWFADSFTPDKDGRLYRYVGKHPEAINSTTLMYIKDFRQYYKFYPEEDECYLQ